MSGTRTEIMYFRTSKTVRKQLETLAAREYRPVSSTVHAIIIDWFERNEAGIVARALVDTPSIYPSEKESA